MVPFRGADYLTEHSVKLRRFFFIGIVVGLSISAILAAGQTASTQVRQSAVSDWTHHYVLFPYTNDTSVMDRLKDDPRWIQSWNLQHRENWWPALRHGGRWKGAGRDWSVPLGTAYYQQQFDSTFTFSVGPQSGFGVLTTTDLGGGQLLATAGTLNVTGGSNLGNYSLFPGGAALTWSPNLAFHFDDLIFPSANPELDFFGLVFIGGGTQVNLFGNTNNDPNLYSFWAWNSGSYVTTISDVSGNISPTISSTPDPGGGMVFPAKYAFNINQAPSCTNDFVVVGIPTSRAVSAQANIIGLNNLYSNASGTGFCPTNGPTVKFAYASGIGQVPASVVISQSGTQVAYVENVPGNSFFHVLTIGTTGNNGTDATDPVNPGAGGGNNALDRRVRLTPDGGTTNQSSTNAPFVVFTPNDTADVAYATTYNLSGGGSGYLYKLNNVFNGSAMPTIVWSVAITAVPSTPIYDRISNKVFFSDSQGRIDYVLDSGTPTVFYGPVVAPSSTSQNTVMVDSARQMVYASFNTNGTNAVQVQAPTTLASAVVVPVGTGNKTFTGPYLPDFNHAWYSGTGTPMMFVAGMDTGLGTQPTLYGIGFTGNVLNSTASASTPLATGAADSSPVTDFYNSTLGKDFLFVGVSDNCIATALGGTSGCIMSLDITNGFPTVNSSSTALAATGGVSGIIPDNNSNLPEASSVYYVTKTGSTLVKATQSGLQ